MTRILVVSRSAALAQRLRDVHDVIEHPVGRVGELAVNETGDVLVLDLGDPDAALRALESVRARGSRTPALIVSSYQPAWASLVERELPGVIVVPLPVTRDALLNGIRQLTDGTRPSGEHGSVAPVPRPTVPPVAPVVSALPGRSTPVDAIPGPVGRPGAAPTEWDGPGPTGEGSPAGGDGRTAAKPPLPVRPIGRSIVPELRPGPEAPASSVGSSEVPFAPDGDLADLDESADLDEDRAEPSIERPGWVQPGWAQPPAFAGTAAGQARPAAAGVSQTGQPERLFEVSSSQQNTGLAAVWPPSEPEPVPPPVRPNHPAPSSYRLDVPVVDSVLLPVDPDPAEWLPTDPNAPTADDLFPSPSRPFSLGGNPPPPPGTPPPPSGVPLAAEMPPQEPATPPSVDTPPGRGTFSAPLPPLSARPPTTPTPADAPAPPSADPTDDPSDRGPAIPDPLPRASTWDRLPFPASPRPALPEQPDGSASPQHGDTGDDVADGIARRRALLGRPAEQSGNGSTLQQRLGGRWSETGLGPGGTSPELVALGSGQPVAEPRPASFPAVPPPSTVPAPPWGTPSPPPAAPRLGALGAPPATVGEEPSAAWSGTDQISPKRRAGDRQNGNAASDSSLRALIGALTLRCGELFGVADTAQVLAEDLVERAETDAAAVLVPDGSVWRVGGSVGLRPLEQRTVLDATHWVVTEIALGGQVLLLQETTLARPKLAGAPLSTWRHLLAVPVPQVQALVMLARGPAARPFGEADLARVAGPVAQAAGLLATAIATRHLARLMSTLCEEEDPRIP